MPRLSNLRTFDAIREMRDAGVAVVGGFHSPMERECLEFLLRGDQPVIVCLARGLRQPRLPSLWRKSIAADRLLLISPFADSVRRTTRAQAQVRNQFVAAVSTAVLIPYASPGGMTDALARQLLEVGRTIFTFDKETSQLLLDCGAVVYRVTEIKRFLTA